MSRRLPRIVRKCSVVIPDGPPAAPFRDIRKLPVKRSSSNSNALELAGTSGTRSRCKLGLLDGSPQDVQASKQVSNKQQQATTTQQQPNNNPTTATQQQPNNNNPTTATQQQQPNSNPTTTTQQQPNSNPTATQQQPNNNNPTTTTQQPTTTQPNNQQPTTTQHAALHCDLKFLLPPLPGSVYEN